MDGYLLDTNAASVLWNSRHPDHESLRFFLQEKSKSPIWVSIIAFGEIEYGLKVTPKMDVDSQKEVRKRMSEYVFLEVNAGGDWRWIEIPTGLPITDAVVDLLIQGANSPVTA